MSAGFTPGPWTASEVRYRRDAMDWRNITAGERETLVGVVLAPDYLTDANANLIAAAPELLGALETIADVLANPVRPGHIAYKSKADLIAIAERAIAKARGQS